MACFGTIPAKVLVIMVAALLYATKITADDSAITPSPLLETGTAFALPWSCWLCMDIVGIDICLIMSSAFLYSYFEYFIVNR
ncbi:hypothetical protein ACFX13_014543 [Malus domestica]